MKENICKICKEVIPTDHCCYHDMHLVCADEEIDVFYVHLPGDEGSGYYEKDIKKVAESLEDIEEPHVICKRKLRAGRYANLPEFDGF